MSASNAIVWTVPGALIVIGDYIIARWLIALTKRLHEQAERIARLEGRTDQDDDGG